MRGKILLMLASVFFTLLVLELGCRLARGPQALLDWKNMVLGERSRWVGQNLGSRFSYDPLLGYTQRPGFRDGLSSYDSNGFRTMPAPPADATEGAPVLATGDSYTQGEEVGDFETWPADLQSLVRRKTINAGVSAYGFDQTVLRTEQLVPKLKPSLLVVGFIADDLRRAEMSRTWGTEKPYFTLNGDKLLLHNVPVPPSPKPADTLDFWQWTFGWSVLVETILEHQGWRYEWEVDHHRVSPPGTGERLSCPLMKRIAALGVPTLVVAQYDFYVWQNADYAADQRRVSKVVLNCAQQAGLASLDLYDATEKTVTAHGRNYVYGPWHPNVTGYRLVAEAIAAELDRRHMAPR